MSSLSSNITRFLFCVSILLSAWACEKISTEPVLPLEPFIELLEVSHEEIKAFDEVLNIRIAYEDGDGDLGTTDSDVNSLFIRDSRLNEEDSFFVGPLAPTGSNISIRGTLNIEVGKFFLLGNGASERTTLSIYIVDRAGNKSNILKTEPITIVR